MIGLNSTGGACKALKAGNMCEDPVVKAICMGTCAEDDDDDDRRLTAETKAHLESARHVYGPHFRQALSTIEAAVVAAGGRRLDSHAVSLYGSWDPTSRPSSCSDLAKSSSAPADYSLLDSTKFYDWFSWLNNKVKGLTIMPSCPDQPTYITDSNKYCDTNNLNILGIEGSVTKVISDKITTDLCWKKCATADGTPDEYCTTGFDPAFNAYSNALCIPRDTCEQYCDDLGGMCAGFEMHNEVPRCYLITDVCTDFVPSTKYDQVTKADAPFRYKTSYNEKCGLTAEATALIPTLDGPREECEKECNKNLDCGGFDYTPDGGMKDGVVTGLCAFRSINRVGFAPAGYCSGGGMTFASTTATSDTLTTQAGTHYVEKMMNGVSVESPWSPPCKAVVDAPPATLPGTALGSYVRTLAADCGAPSQAVVCYMSPTQSHRLVWGNQAKYSSAESMMYLEGATGIARQCSGWVLEAANAAGDYEPIYATYLGAGFECPSAPATYSLNKPDGYVGMYSWKPAEDPSVSMSYVCKSYPMCGTLQTCVLAKNRFYSEVSIQLATETTTAACDDTPGFDDGYGYGCADWYGDYNGDGIIDCLEGQDDIFNIPLSGYTKAEMDNIRAKCPKSCGSCPVIAPAHGFISDEKFYEKLLDPLTFRPKTLISVEMAILFVAKVKAQYGMELYRNVPGHLRIKIAELGAGVSSAVIKMVSAAGTTLFGSAYTVPAGYEPWYTDVVRVEKFGAKGKLDAGGPMTIDFYAPTVPNLMVVGFGKDGAEIAKLPASTVPGSPGYWRVKVAVSGDYVGTTESPCPKIPFGATTSKPANAEDGLECPDVDAGAECTLICKATYVPSGPLTCSMGSWSTVTCDKVKGYEAETQFFRLSHRSRLDYGWRIRKIMAFTDDACTNQINANDVAITGPSESYLGQYPAEEATANGLNSIRTSNLNDETACLGPQSTCHDFWSKGLNVNPYPVDETHGGAAFVEFTVDSDQSVQCVVVALLILQ
jgi:hypothetical protein